MPSDSVKEGSKNTCEMCGMKGISESIETEQFTYGTGKDAVELAADVVVFKCDSCGVTYTGEQAEVARHEAVCRHEGLLTPAEIRSGRERLGLTQAELATVTRFGDASIKRWESGSVLQNAAADQVLRLVFVHPRGLATLREVEALRAPPKPKSQFRTKPSEEALRMSRLFQLRPRESAGASCM